MTTETKVRTKEFRVAASAVRFKADGEGEPGSFVARFCTFNVIDRHGEVVLPSFFTDGQRVLMAAWGHGWGMGSQQLNPGQGFVKVESDGADFHGQFYLDTLAGKETYLTVKRNADLQEWSFGFEVLDGEPGKQDGQDVWFLKRGIVYEVSPVLIGAGVDTGTREIKGLMGIDGPRMKHLAERVRLDVDSYITRSKARAELRAKEGREFSEANLNQMEEVARSMKEGASTLDEMVTRARKPKEGKGLDPDLLLAQFRILTADIG